MTDLQECRKEIDIIDKEIAGFRTRGEYRRHRPAP